MLRILRYLAWQAQLMLRTLNPTAAPASMLHPPKARLLALVPNLATSGVLYDAERGRPAALTRAHAQLSNLLCVV